MLSVGTAPFAFGVGAFPSFQGPNFPNTKFFRGGKHFRAVARISLKKHSVPGAFSE